MPPVLLVSSHSRQDVQSPGYNSLISHIWSKRYDVSLRQCQKLKSSKLILYSDYAGWADKIAGESFIDDDGLYKIVQYEPIGVCAGIASWNATFLYVAWKIAPALAAGNTVSRRRHGERCTL